METTDKLRKEVGRILDERDSLIEERDMLLAIVKDTWDSAKYFIQGTDLFSRIEKVVTQEEFKHK